MTEEKNARTMTIANDFVTPVGRLSYPNLFQAKLNQLNGEREYTVDLKFSEDADLSEFKKLVHKGITDRWGSDKSKWPKNLVLPFKKDEDGVYISAKRKEKQGPPGIVDGKNQKIGPERQSEIYGGCYGRLAISIFSYHVADKDGVSIGLQHIQKTADGEAFGQMSVPEQVFAPIDNGDQEGEELGDIDDLFDGI